MLNSSRGRHDALSIGCTDDTNGATRNFTVDTLSATGTGNDTTAVIPRGCSGLWVLIESQSVVGDKIEFKLLLDDSTTVTIMTVGASTIDQGNKLGRFWIPLDVTAVTSSYPKFRIQGATGATGTNVVEVIAVNASGWS